MKDTKYDKGLLELIFSFDKAVSSNFDRIDDNHKSNYIALKNKLEKLTLKFSAQISMIGQL